mmetsp:Transcript_13140/g.27902  ORF Transcript_13140/g.27902 Transcript_13140/m.27902 type:complete len:112 (+) Transcript_13140:1180-1515(+)
MLIGEPLPLQPIEERRLEARYSRPVYKRSNHACTCPGILMQRPDDQRHSQDVSLPATAGIAAAVASRASQHQCAKQQQQHSPPTPTVAIRLDDSSVYKVWSIIEPRISLQR